MAVKSIPFADSTADQRRRFASDFLNLDIGADATDEAVNAQIERAQPGITTIFALEEEVSPELAAIDALPPVELKPEERGGRMEGTLGKDDPRWLIVIPTLETEDGSGSRDVFVGVNGRAWQLKRGVELNLPHRVIVALDLAIAEILRHDDEGNEVRRSSKRFTYDVVERPTRAAIEAWDIAIGAEFCA
jgi:hypothetical protein